MRNHEDAFLIQRGLDDSVDRRGGVGNVEREALEVMRYCVNKRDLAFIIEVWQSAVRPQSDGCWISREDMDEELCMFLLGLAKGLLVNLAVGSRTTLHAEDEQAAQRATLAVASPKAKVG